MRYQKNGAWEFRQRALQLVLGVYVQMVGRLVENQPVVLAVHHNRQPYLGVFAAAEYAHLAGDMLVRQAALGETKPHLPVLHRRKLRPEGIQRRFLRIARRLLLEIAREKIIAQLHLTAKRRQLAEDCL